MVLAPIAKCWHYSSKGASSPADAPKLRLCAEAGWLVLQCGCGEWSLRSGEWSLRKAHGQACAQYARSTHVLRHSEGALRHHSVLASYASTAGSVEAQIHRH